MVVLRSLLLILLFLPSTLLSQTLIGDSLSRQPGRKILKMAKQSQRLNDHYSAIELYNLYLKKRPKKQDARYQLGMTYLATRNYRQASNVFIELTSKNPEDFPKAWFYLGQCQKSLGEYQRAKTSFEQFNKLYKGLKDKSVYRRKLKIEMAGLVIADSLLDHPLPATITSINGLNLKHSESAPLATSDTTMLFSALQKDELPMISMIDSAGVLPKMKIYEAKLENGSWRLVGLLNSEINEAEKHIVNPVLGIDGLYLYYAQCDENWQGEITCQIYQSRKVNGKWKRPEAMPKGINLPNHSSSQPAIGIEPKRNRPIMYFVSDRPKGRGGKDIWWSQYNKRDDEWSKPRNAGSKINTSGDEETPWIDQTHGTMYFSSNGHPGIGGMDVYATIGEKSKWSPSEILGIPINSGADDVYFRKELRDRYQFVVSNRDGSLSLWNNTCCDDIYQIFYPTTMEMILQLKVSELPADALGMQVPALVQGGSISVYLVDPTTGEKFLVSTHDLETGQIDLGLEPGKMYWVEASKPGYFTNGQLVDLRKNKIDDREVRDITIQRWDDKPILIPNINFEFNDSEMTADSKIKLESSLVKLLLENPDIIIEIGAHSDNKGSDEFNLKLSTQRAQGIVKFLNSKGIDKTRMKATGYGETKPIAPNENADGTDNPEGRAKNRRVEFKVIGTTLDIRTSNE